MLGYLVAAGDEPTLVACQLILGGIGVGKCLYAFGTADETQIHIEHLLVVGAVDTSHVPGIAAATGQHHALAGITAHVAGLIPCGGQLSEEILYLLRLHQIALGFVGQVLQGTLVQYGQSQFVGIAGNMWML